MPVFSRQRAGCEGKATHRSRLVCVLKAASGLCLLLLTIQDASAETLRPSQGSPDEADLRQYLECSRIADEQMLGFVEAYVCSRALLRIQLSFIPGMTLESFEQLPPSEKSAASRVGYLRYRDWVKANAAWLETLKDPSGS